MRIEDVLENRESFAIYGTGVLAQKLFELLSDDDKKRLECFIVSDGISNEAAFNGFKVVELSKYFQREKSVIFIALSESHKDEVIANIERKNFKYLYVLEDDYKFLYRKKNAFDTKTFIDSSNPVSRVFGLDRGEPIDRYYIDKFIDRERKSLSNVCRTLEVGELSYSNCFFPNAEHEVLDYGLGMDLTKPGTIKENFYDVFICTQTLNFIYDVHGAIKGCYNLLKPGGVMLATVAGNISQISRYDMDRWGDYWRFTGKSIKMLIEESFGNSVSIYPFGNSMAATAFIQGLCVEEVDTRLLDVCDSDYSIVIGIVAQKV